MICSCRNKKTQKVLERRFSKRFHAIEKPARVRLELLDAAPSLQDLNLPGLRLEAVKEGRKGDRKGQHSIRINDQYRICFEWRDGDACNVEIIESH